MFVCSFPTDPLNSARPENLFISITVQNCLYLLIDRFPDFGFRSGADMNLSVKIIKVNYKLHDVRIFFVFPSSVYQIVSQKSTW